MISTITFLIGVLPALVSSNDISVRSDPLGNDADLETVHIYNGQWPCSIAVSASGRKFSAYSGGLDELNTNNGSNNVFQVAELTGFDQETAYPNEDINNPPGGAVDTSGPFPKTKGLSDYLLAVVDVVIDFNDVLWILDTGRVLYKGVLLDASPDGPKLVSVDLATDKVTRTYTFPSSIVKAITYLADVRFDTGRRIAYISDSSPAPDNAIIVLDLQTGDARRTLERDSTVTAIPGFVPWIYGEPVYQVQTSGSGRPIGAEYFSFGLDGLALSPDLETLYYSVDGGRYLFSVPTEILRNNASSPSDQTSAVRNLGEKGFSIGIVSDSLGNIYCGNDEQDAVSVYNTTTGFAVVFVRDKRINFVARLSVADTFLYLLVDQYNYVPTNYQGKGPLGVDRRQKPLVLFRVPLPDNATKGPGS